MMMPRTTLALCSLAVLVSACKAPQRQKDEPVGTTETRSSPIVGEAGAETPIEGRISMQLVGKPAETFDYAIAGDKTRIALASTSGTGQGVEAIVDRKGKEATVVLYDKKQYSRVGLGSLKEPQAEDVGRTVKVDKLGKTSVVAGHTCEEWKLTGPEYQALACVMKAVPGFDLEAIGKLGDAKPPAWLDRVVDEGYVPLRVALSDSQGNAIPGAYGEWASTRVDPQVFEPPKDFKEKPAGAVR